MAGGNPASPTIFFLVSSTGHGASQKRLNPPFLARIKIDLRGLFVSVIDHTNGTEHGLLFFKERVFDRQEFDESSALEAAILEGVASPHQPYDARVMDRIRHNARSLA